MQYTRNQVSCTKHTFEYHSLFCSLLNLNCAVGDLFLQRWICNEWVHVFITRNVSCAKQMSLTYWLLSICDRIIKLNWSKMKSMNRLCPCLLPLICFDKHIGIIKCMTDKQIPTQTPIADNQILIWHEYLKDSLFNVTHTLTKIITTDIGRWQFVFVALLKYKNKHKKAQLVFQSLIIL
jgi:hypothetical protein